MTRIDRAQWTPAWSEAEGAARAAQAFRREYGGDPAGVWAAPGRINLIGEHVDYCGGLVLPVALPHAAYVAARAREDGWVRLSAAQPRARSEGPLHRFGAPGPGRWESYVGGPAWVLAEEHGPADRVCGVSALVTSTVPVGAGLSSSAAVGCAMALAVDELWGLGLAGTDAGRARLAAACVRAENEIAGAPTGGLDQAAALRTRAGHALLLDCRDGGVEHVPAPLEGAGLALLVIDTRAPHTHADGQYAERRASCVAAARRLAVPDLRSLADALAGDEEAMTAALAELPDPVTRRRARHVVTEIERVRRAVGLLRAQDWPALGAVLDDSHASLRDDYAVSCPELDAAVVAAREAGAWGARMTGGGFGGSAIALIPSARVGPVADAVSAAFAGAGFAAPQFLVARPAAAGRRVS